MPVWYVCNKVCSDRAKQHVVCSDRAKQHFWLLQLALPELPATKRRKVLDLGLPLADVLVLADEAATATYYENVFAAGAPPKAAANWVIGDIMAHCKVFPPVVKGKVAVYP